LKPITLYDGRFTLEEEIAQGGFATIYRARERNREETLAIKVGRVDANDPGIGESIRKEARILSELNHQGIVKIYPIARSNAHHDHSARAVEIAGHPDFFVMEHLRGGALKDLLKAAGSLPPAEAAAIALYIARGLHYMHGYGYAHNDLKLENIVMRQPVRSGEPYTPVLVDLGVATLIHPPIAVTLYITPPEQLRHTKMEIAPELENIDRKKVDVWGLGIVLYCMLGGRLPFVGSEKSLTQRILRDRPTALTRLSSLIPAEMEELVIDGCLAKNPADRLTMLELGRCLRNYGQDVVAGRDIAPGGRNRRFWRRH
jgi:serine/threonine-protein kinase